MSNIDVEGIRAQEKDRRILRVFFQELLSQKDRVVLNTSYIRNVEKFAIEQDPVISNRVLETDFFSFER